VTEWPGYLQRLEALKKVDARVAANPDDTEAHFDRGRLLTDLDRPVEARDAYIEVIKRSPAHFGALNNLGGVLYSGGFRSAARSAYAEAVARNPENPLGHFNLGNLLREEGDLDGARAESVARRCNATLAAVDEVLWLPVDIVAPCAMGGILNASTISQLRCRAIAGAANNQLANTQAGASLAARGIVYAPDYAINVGGLIDLVHARRGDYRLAAVLEDCRGIYATTLDILGRATASGEATNVIADRLAEERFRDVSVSSAVRAGRTA